MLTIPMLSTFTAVLLASPADHEPKRDRGNACAGLSCTKEQKETIKEIRKTLRSSTHDEKIALNRLHKEIARAFAADSFDANRIEGLAAEAAALRARIVEERIDALEATHAVLTPEQREMLAARMERHADKAKRGKARGKQKREANPEVEDHAVAEDRERGGDEERGRKRAKKDRKDRKGPAAKTDRINNRGESNKPAAHGGSKKKLTAKTKSFAAKS